MRKVYTTSHEIWRMKNILRATVNGEIKVPAWLAKKRRGKAWMIRTLDDICRNLPIGTVTIWKYPDETEETDEKPSVGYILAGAEIIGVLNVLAPPMSNEDEDTEKNRWEFGYELETGTVIQQKRMTQRAGTMPMKAAMDTQSFHETLDRMREKWPKAKHQWEKAAQTWAGAVMDYQIVVTCIHNITRDDAWEIAERLEGPGA